jgi:ferritin-like metal-binding protein YciE
MRQNAFYEIFIDLLRNIFDGENQLVENLPKVIQATSNLELKDALVQHLDETKTQVLRLKTIFKTLNENPVGEPSKGMKGLIEECQQVLNMQISALAKDAYLIIICQKIEHDEMAAYGSARAIANHLNHTSINDRVDFDEIASILQQSLDEEGAANETLTDIAEGGFFTEGINDAAEKEESQLLDH